MEPSQFDEFTKAMATSTSRRQAIKTFIASTFGGILALSGLGSAFASTCKPPCSPGLTCCGGKCVDTKKDPKNCGVCGTVCASGKCVNGVCCPPGAVICSTSSGDQCCSFTCCGGVHEQKCVDTEHDPNNCGGCGIVCPAGDKCCKGKCVDTSKDPNNCGTCGHVCPSGVCNNGVCPCVTAGCASACPGNNSCDCVNTVDKGIVCVHPVCTFVSCMTSADCPMGEVCFTQGCCGGGNFCVPTC